MERHNMVLDLTHIAGEACVEALERYGGQIVATQIGFGVEETPAEIDTVADLPKIAEALTHRGYDQAAIEAIMAGNWLRVLRQALPE